MRARSALRLAHERPPDSAADLHGFDHRLGDLRHRAGRHADEAMICLARWLFQVGEERRRAGQLRDLPSLIRG